MQRYGVSPAYAKPWVESPIPPKQKSDSGSTDTYNLTQIDKEIKRVMLRYCFITSKNSFLASCGGTHLKFQHSEAEAEDCTT